MIRVAILVDSGHKQLNIQQKMHHTIILFEAQQ